MFGGCTVRLGQRLEAPGGVALYFTDLRGVNTPRERYFFASGFQFCSSVIGAVALVQHRVDEEAPVGGDVVLPTLLRVHAAAEDARAERAPPARPVRAWPR